MKVPTMDDGPNSAPHNGQLGPSSSTGTGCSNGKQNNQDEHNPRSQYSIPGILHFIQHEWARFEMERSQWEVERAELQARIAFLQGERKGQENLKNDLVRRIKMLEYALKQERSKFHKLKYGTELQQGDMKPPILEDGLNEPIEGDSIFVTHSNVNWRQGRQLLRQYLQEIGYTDTIIDVRSNRVRSLLGLGSGTDKDGAQGGGNAMNGAGNEQGRRTPAKKAPPASLAEAMILDTEAAIASLDFLKQEGVNVDVDDEDDMSDDMDEVADDENEDAAAKRRKTKAKASDRNRELDDVDAETEEVLNEFSFLGSESDDSSHELRVQSDSTDWGRSMADRNDPSDWVVNQTHISQLKEQYRRDRAKNKKGLVARPKRSVLQDMLTNLGLDEDLGSSSPSAGSILSSPAYGLSHGGPSQGSPARSNDLSSDSLSGISFSGSGTGPRRAAASAGASEGHMTGLGVQPSEEGLDGTLGLGELAQLTVNNEAETSYDITVNTESFRKTWNAKYTLRSHFDGVRALAFHPVEPVLVTASEDCTLKLWNLQKTISAKKSTAFDVEPVYTFRGHVGPVLCLAMSATGEQCFSGGLDSTIQCWNIPNSNIDPYDSYDPSVMSTALLGHTDAVCGLSLHSQKLHLLSCSADGSIRLWNPQSKTPQMSIFTSELDGIPTSVDFVRDDPNHLVASYSSGGCIIYDLETANPVVRLETDQGSDVSAATRQIYRVISHPTLPLTITAHEDRHIRFFDNLTGKLVHSMVAHLDAVTCLAVDPSGLYLLSGSHDCSIRLWNLENKTCVQEITSHRKKFDEAIFDVAFHPSKPFIASAGADALAKVFV